MTTYLAKLGDWEAATTTINYDNKINASIQDQNTECVDLESHPDSLMQSGPAARTPDSSDSTLHSKLCSSSIDAVAAAWFGPVQPAQSFLTIEEQILTGTVGSMRSDITALFNLDPASQNEQPAQSYSSAWTNDVLRSNSVQMSEELPKLTAFLDMLKRAGSNTSGCCEAAHGLACSKSGQVGCLVSCSTSSCNRNDTEDTGSANESKSAGRLQGLSLEDLLQQQQGVLGELTLLLADLALESALLLNRTCTTPTGTLLSMSMRIWYNKL